MKLKSVLSNFWVESTLNSYSIILFSNNKLLAVILMLVTFMTPKIGLTGLFLLLSLHFLLVQLGYNKQQIQSGLLGFNALLIGLSIAYIFEINVYFIGLFLISLLLSLAVTIWCKNYFDRYHLPFLTFPFVIIMNIITLSTKSFDVFTINMDYVFNENTIAVLKQNNWYQWVHSLDNLNLPEHFRTFLYTLSTIFFQKSILAGILILIGILIYSRIAVIFSLLGFYSAVFFYEIMGGNLESLNYFYSGVNFIFLAIALGCFFYIANKSSIVLVIVLCPILMFLMITMNKILAVFQMDAMSLSFSVLTSMTLYILYNRNAYNLIIPANISFNSPELSRYEYLHQSSRKIANPYYSMYLPFWGEWFVSQGYDGKITHLGEWGKALDFVIKDEEDNTYSQFGQKVENFYCYNKPVLAPADGYIYDIINHVEENEINEVNVNQNWGNSILINHVNGLYSQISHIKLDSILVNIGDYVKKGTMIATCGNSGRSPEPHIHFQVQHAPTFGAKTVNLPLSYFIENKGNEYEFKVNEIPQENTIVSNVEELPLLLNTFNFVPNNRLKITNEKTSTTEVYEIYTNEYNQLYFYCAKTDTRLYFKNDGVLFTFEKFEGSTRTSLFEFYKSSYSILLGYYPAITLDYFMPKNLFTHFGLLVINDIFSPVYNFINVRYNSNAEKIDNLINPNHITISSKYQTELFGKVFFETKYIISVFGNSSLKINNIKTNTTYKVECVPYF
jgi:urea transporter/murein DD-endopeptidase MepM/ murein hydrolase activator NlpD